LYQASESLINENKSLLADLILFCLFSIVAAQKWRCFDVGNSNDVFG
jgi:hypothetical protein